MLFYFFADNFLLILFIFIISDNLKNGDISDLVFQTLKMTSENFIRPETLQTSNDLVTNAITQFPLFRHYNINEMVHSSSDGQKFETKLPTFNARHSPKYFGLQKGVVAYTLVINHIPVNARIIGANEHESQYVFDLLFNNTTNIQRIILSLAMKETTYQT